VDELEVREAAAPDLAATGAAWVKLQDLHRSLGLAFPLPANAAQIWLDLATSVRIMHLALASAVWGVLVFAVTYRLLNPHEKAGTVL